MPRLRFHPLAPERWAHFEALFGSRGACGGCWCMWWRLPHSQFEQQKGEANRQAMRALVESGAPTGLLAYDQGQAVGWCAVAPREAYPRLQRSRVLKPVDDQPVWSVTCFFVAKSHRGQGLTVELLRAAIRHVRDLGGRVVEGYPIQPRQGAIPAAFAFTGLASSFLQAGFVECARRSETRPMMRFPVRAAR